MEPPTKDRLEVVGLLYNASYHVIRIAAEAVQDSDTVQITYRAMIEAEWEVFLDAERKRLGGEMWAFDDTACALLNGKLLGDSVAFLHWVKERFGYEEFRPIPLYQAMAKEAYQDYVDNSQHEFVFMAISIGEKLAGRLVLELYSDYCPNTCENFKTLCTSASTEAGTAYRGSLLHRIVKNGWLQGGDIIDGSGGNSVSIYNGHFEDECFELKHDRRGVLGMANEGAHTNGSQFYITFKPCPWLDKKSVAFGRVIAGWDVLEKIENVETFNERPTESCRISSCGLWAPP